MERKKDKDTKAFLDALQKEKSVFLDETAPAIASTGAFAQSANISLAILKQAWQDIQFLQLCMVEGFSGSTYKMPVEFQSHDLYSEEDFAVGELDSIPTENVQTFLLEFGAQWLKKGFIVTKEAQKELLSGPMRYDVIAANAASIANAAFCPASTSAIEAPHLNPLPFTSPVTLSIPDTACAIGSKEALNA